MARANGFTQAFPGLLERARSRATRVLGGDAAAAEDIAAETMGRAFARWPELDEDLASAWVAKVATNLAIDTLRRREAWIPHPVLCDLETETIRRVQVAEALSGLPRRQRESVALRYLAGFAEAEVAQVLGISQNSVKTHLRRGIAALRDRLGPDVDECCVRHPNLASEFRLEMDGLLGPALELPPPRRRPLTDVSLEVLRSFGYRRGYARNWLHVRERLTGVGVFVFEFSSAQGARWYHELAATAIGSLALPDVSELVLPALEGARGIVWKSLYTPDSYLTLLSFVRGRFDVWMQSEALAEESAVDLVRHVARRQDDKLRRLEV